MRWLIRRLPVSFKGRIALLIVMLGLVTTGIDFLVGATFHYRLTRTQLEDNIHTHRQIIGEQLVEALLYDDIYRMFRLLRTVHENSFLVDNLYLVDRNFDYITDARVTKRFPYVDIDHSAHRTERLGYFAYMFRLHSAGKTLGHLVFEVRKESFYGHILSSMLGISLANGLIILVGIALGLRLSFRLTQPLEVLTDRIHRADSTHALGRIDAPAGMSAEVLQLHDTIHQTARKLLRRESELRRQQHLASLGTLSAGLAHEIKNPIMTIDLLAYRLQRELEDNSCEEDLQVLRTESRRLVARLDEFLEYARPLDVSRVDSDLAALLQHVRLGFLTRYDHMECHLDCPAGTHWQTDADRLQQALWIILTNAAEAGATRVCIDVRPGDDELMIRLCDNGPGMDAATWQQVFQPFFTTKSTGSGLGLAICERIVDALGGSIDLHENPAGGCCFRITIKEAEA